MKKMLRILLLLVTALCLIGGGTALAATETPTINVTGTYTVSAKPDLASITLGVTTDDKDAGNAQTQTNKTMNAIIKRMTQMGIKKDSMTTQQISIYTVYDYNDGKQTLRGYQATQMLSIRMTNLDNVGKVIDAAIKSGANQIYNVTFSLRDRTKAYNEALEKAITDARTKADLMAKAAGKTIKNVITINESGSYVYAETAAAMLANDNVGNAANNSTSTLPGLVNVTANVTISFSMK